MYVYVGPKVITSKIQILYLSEPFTYTEIEFVQNINDIKSEFFPSALFSKKQLSRAPHDRFSNVTNPWLFAEFQQAHILYAFT